MRCLREPCGSVRRAGVVEYLIEAWGLGTFMVAASVFAVLLEHPSSSVRMMISSPFVRRALMGAAMGMTALVILYSPWGKRSGAHINPAVTLAFLRLGRIHPIDAVFYIAAQCFGAVSGVLGAFFVLRARLSHPAVAFVVTKPGPSGTVSALMGEAFISATMMLVVLLCGASRLSRATGLAAACLVALFITFEAPLSGMSINPARTLGSAVVAGDYDAFWVYLLAPTLGMLAATEIYKRLERTKSSPRPA
jgi:aquaporin Z